MTQNTTEHSIESLEDNYWGDPPEDATNLIRECHYLRTKPLNQLSAGDMRLLLGQTIGTQFIMPLAIEKLRSDIMLEGSYYPGDLLFSVLRIPDEFWQAHSEWKDHLQRLLKAEYHKVDEADVTDEIKQDIGSLLRFWISE